MNYDIQSEIFNVCGEAHKDLANKIIRYEQDIDQDLANLVLQGEKDLVRKIVELRRVLKEERSGKC